MDWEILKNRRRTTLEQFITDCEDEQSALKLFEKRGITNPPVQEIVAFFESRKAQKTLKTSDSESNSTSKNQKVSSATAQ